MFGQVNAEYRERAMSEEADTASLVVVAEKKRQHSARYSNTPSPERAREGVENKKQKTADLVSVAMETDERAREQKESDLDYACAAKDVNAAQKKAANKPKTKNSVEEKDFSKLSVKALKEKCKEKGLLLKGKKEDLIERLKNPLEHLQNCLGKRGTTTDQVDAALRFFGIKAPTKTAKCAREAIRNGSLKISDGGLDKTIFTGTCEDGCGKTLTCTLRDLLYQKDSGEDDYDNGAQSGALQCDGDCEYGYYVTNACYGFVIIMILFLLLIVIIIITGK
jgi:hypothetical protein